VSNRHKPIMALPPCLFAPRPCGLGGFVSLARSWASGASATGLAPDPMECCTQPKGRVDAPLGRSVLFI
jgi:hypothetical protein